MNSHNSPDTINLVKVFSATKRRDREEVGDRVTAWLRDHPKVDVFRAVVALTSDREFHCYSLVLLAHEHPSDPGAEVPDQAS